MMWIKVIIAAIFRVKFNIHKSDPNFHIPIDLDSTCDHPETCPRHGHLRGGAKTKEAERRMGFGDEPPPTAYEVVRREFVSGDMQRSWTKTELVEVD